jgi:CRP-like cAMP-binding protein
MSETTSVLHSALDRATTRNRLLAGLSDADFALLRPGLVRCALPLRKQLQSRGRVMENAIFIEQGIASVIASTGSQGNIEVGLIGQEGVTGTALIMGAVLSPYDTFIQSPGHGWSLDRQNLHRAMATSASFRDRLILYCHTLMVQMAHTALANGRYTIEQRLARWLLMTRDRSLDGPAALTHEFLATMLGVRRPGVTTALNGLEQRGLIGTARGAITVLDRIGLEEQTNGSYGAPEAEYDRVFPPAPHRSGGEGAMRALAEAANGEVG